MVHLSKALLVKVLGVWFCLKFSSKAFMFFKDILGGVNNFI